MQTLQPTFIEVDDEVLRKAEYALQRSLDHVRGALVEHDNTFGRSTIKNETWANVLVGDIVKISEAIADVRNALGWYNEKG